MPQIFAGEYKEAVGTSALFELTADGDDGDPVFAKSPTLSVDYVCKTGRKLKLKRVFLNEKRKKEEEAKGDSK